MQRALGTFDAAVEDERTRVSEKLDAIAAESGAPNEPAWTADRPAHDKGARRWDAETTVNDAIDGWIANGWDDLSPSTTTRYRSIVENHIRPTIGRVRIVDLSPYDVERWLRDLKDKGLAKDSVRQTRAILHRACRLARKWSGNRLPNPIQDTELPEWRLEEQADEVRSPHQDEVRALLEAALAYDLRIGVYVRLVAATGVRRGEAGALRWSDVSFERGTVRLDESLVATGGTAKVKSPKNRNSIRTVAVDEGTLDLLQMLRDKQAAIATSVGVDVGVDGFVFATDVSGAKPPHPDGFSTAFQRIRTRAGVAPDVHLHSFRHFQSTELDAVISEAQKQSRMGWATVQMARHYTDVVPEADRAAAVHIGTVLGPSPAVNSAEDRPPPPLPNEVVESPPR